MLLIIVAGVGAAAAAIAFIASASRTHADPIDPTAEERALQRFIARRPKLRRFLRERFDRRTAGGFLLTIGFLIVFAVALLLGLLLTLIEHNDFLTKADTSVSQWGFDHASSRTVDALRWITYIGATPVVFTYLALVAAIDFVRRRNLEVFVFVAIIGIGELLLNNGIKVLVRRDRPSVLHLVSAHGYSFPSGHACAAAACTSAVALVLGRDRSRTTRAALAALAVLATIGVATSRALLGVHWLSDVLAGVMLGWGWFMLVAVVFGGRRQHLGEPVEAVTAAADQPLLRAR
ncbi:MAG: phosphatase family protein [Ilumatobacteraceae bacterium]|nr:phosphatase family protein [Ilumatobacteraceae bacterium]